MDELIKSLPIVLRAAGQSQEVAEATAIAAFRYAAGPGLREHAVPLRLQERTLVVAVNDQIWQKQMTSVASQLVFRVNSILGQSSVTRIEVIVEPMVNTARKSTTEEDVEPVEADVSPELWAAANAIQDTALRKNFLKAASASLKRRTQM
jgi:hypothetical protein